jgi:DNA-binding GntR family transcriptional regulator
LKPLQYKEYVAVPIQRSPLRSQLREAILELVEGGQLPPASRVRDTELARRLAVSRTPVREALLDLARDGLLTGTHGRGFRVPALDPAEVRELGQLLGALEALALRLSPPPTPDRLAALERCLDALDAARGDVPRLLALNEAWHLELVAGCGNGRLLARLVPLRRGLRRYVAAFLHEGGSRGLATSGPRRVLAALRTGDTAAAAARLDEQLVSGTAELAAWLERRAPQAAGSARSIGSR